MEPSRYFGVVFNHHILLFNAMICCVAQKCFRIHSVVQATLKLLARLYYPPELGDSWYELSRSQHCRMLSWEHQLYGFRDYLYPHFSLQIIPFSMKKVSSTSAHEVTATVDVHE